MANDEDSWRRHGGNENIANPIPGKTRWVDREEAIVYDFGGGDFSGASGSSSNLPKYRVMI